MFGHEQYSLEYTQMKRFNEMQVRIDCLESRNSDLKQVLYGACKDLAQYINKPPGKLLDEYLARISEGR